MANQFYLETEEPQKRPKVIICISSDEESDGSDGMSSFWGSFHSSDENMEIDDMATDVDTLMEEFTAPRPAIGRGMTIGRSRPNSPSTLPGPSGSSYPSTPTTSSSIYFDEKMCYAPSKRDPKLRRQHPIELCSTLVPVVDTPISPMPQDRPQVETTQAQQSTDWSQGPTVDNVVTHFQNLEVGNSSPFPDCLICGRSVAQIKNDAVEDYVIRTSTPGEPESEKQKRRDAYIAGMAMGTFLFVPQGLSQAAACDGVNYTLRMGTCSAATIPGTLPLN